jgi:16S rRNA (guanine527-N7)-methyltransferase
MPPLKMRIPTIIDLGFRADGVPQLEAFLDHLWDSNTHLNLISRKMLVEELIDNHVIDCLLPLKHFPQDRKVVADFGSGGGLPGVIYALQFPNIRFRLYEKSRLKQEFLRTCKEIAPNIEILGEIPPALGDIDLVVSRAFKSVAVLLDISRSYHTKGGKYFLLKARRDKLDEEIADARKQFKDLKVEIVPLKSPVLEVQRNLVLID